MYAGVHLCVNVRKYSHPHIRIDVRAEEMCACTSECGYHWMFIRMCVGWWWSVFHLHTGLQLHDTVTPETTLDMYL